MVKPKQLAHIVLRVRDLERSKQFYMEVLGLHLTNQTPGMIFLAADTNASHEIAFQQATDLSDPPAGGVGLAHFAWQMNTWEDLQEMYERLKQFDVKFHAIMDHGIALGVYFFDPDGNRSEVFYELPAPEWSRVQTEPGVKLFSGKFPMSLEEPVSV